MDECGTITAAQAVFIADRVSCALLAAHSANVMHRNISPIISCFAMTAR